MDGRKLRDYYLSFYAPKFLIPISRSRLSVVMSHFLISAARSDYYAIEPLYKTLISPLYVMRWGIGDAGWQRQQQQHCFSLQLPRHGPQPGLEQSWGSCALAILRWTIVYGFIVLIVASLISTWYVLLFYTFCLIYTCASNMAFANKQLDEYSVE